jgi:hypothetical protein
LLIDPDFLLVSLFFALGLRCFFFADHLVEASLCGALNVGRQVSSEELANLGLGHPQDTRVQRFFRHNVPQSNVTANLTRPAAIF